MTKFKVGGAKFKVFFGGVFNWEWIGSGHREYLEASRRQEAEGSTGGTPAELAGEDARAALSKAVVEPIEFQVLV
jgi:hypothetical protein